jgi:hypothetical protein
VRDDASFCRPRLYDEDDPKFGDEVGEVVEALQMKLEREMARGNTDSVERISTIKQRVENAAGRGGGGGGGGD